MKEYSLTITKDEWGLLWCETMSNLKYWKQQFLYTKDESDYNMYHVARTSFCKLQRINEDAIYQTIKGISHKKYKLIWK